MMKAKGTSIWLQAGLLATALLLGLACPIQAALPNGVASGDVTQGTAVLWARSTVPGTVTFEYSTDPTFIIKSTAAAEVSEAEVPVKVEISGLDPGMQYYYRATDAEAATAEGRFRTPAALGAQAGLHFGATGDWHHEPPFPALKNVAGSDLDFFIKLGDTIYADFPTAALPPGRDYSQTLADFRAKHKEILSGRFGANFMVPLGASTSVLATIDDHEVVDNFAGGALPGESKDLPDLDPPGPPLFTGPVSYVNETQGYLDAMQAFQEYNPIRSETWTGTGDARLEGKMKLYRKVNYGSDAVVMMLDTRSFRDVQLAPVSDPLDPAESLAFLAQTFDPTRTLLGRAQMEALKADLLQAKIDGVAWKFVVVPEPIQNFGVVGAEDRFEGYAAERTELLEFIDVNQINNVVFLAADHHGTSVNNLTYQKLVAGPGGLLVPVSTPTNAFEIMTGPVAFYDHRLGPVLVEMADAAGMFEIIGIPGFDKETYELLPVANDSDSLVNDKDDFVKQLINIQFTLTNTQLGLLGMPPVLDPIGLNDNLPAADGLIDAELLQGDYLAAHTFGWAEFEIDPDTQELLVTIWGIDAYSEDTLQADPGAIIGLEPRVVSQFRVQPIPEPGTLALALPALAGLVLVVLRRRRR